VDDTADVTEADDAHEQQAFAFHPLHAKRFVYGNGPTQTETNQHNAFKRTHNTPLSSFHRPLHKEPACMTIRTDIQMGFLNINRLCDRYFLTIS
jgi:hypothetical protein